MTARDNGGPAFAHDPGGPFPQQVSGITVRDYFAAAAMQGWMGRYWEEGRHPVSLGTAAAVAFMSYRLADAMLAERAQ